MAQEPMLLFLKAPDYPFLLAHLLPSLGTPDFYLLQYRLTTTGPRSRTNSPVMGTTSWLSFFMVQSKSFLLGPDWGGVSIALVILLALGFLICLHR